MILDFKLFYKIIEENGQKQKTAMEIFPQRFFKLN